MVEVTSIVFSGVGSLLVCCHRRICHQCKCRHRRLHHVNLGNQEEAVEALRKNQTLGSWGAERQLKRAPELGFKFLQMIMIGAPNNNNSKNKNESNSSE